MAEIRTDAVILLGQQGDMKGILTDHDVARYTVIRNLRVLKSRGAVRFEVVGCGIVFFLCCAWKKRAPAAEDACINDDDAVFAACPLGRVCKGKG